MLLHDFLYINFTNGWNCYSVIGQTGGTSVQEEQKNGSWAVGNALFPDLGCTWVYKLW